MHEAVAIYAAWLEEALTRGIYLGWVYELEGQIIAGVGLTLLEWGPTRDDPNPTCARLVNLYTALEHRKCGLARSLVAQALAEAEARGICTVRLSTTDAARRLYASFGFVERTNEMRLEWTARA
jgi:GNAT superfamily N-acetyltransferase